ncbi:MAG: ATP-binding protein [Pirellulales bacterium]
MTAGELQQLVQAVQRRRSELENIEVKSARGGTPKRLYEPLSAFANRTGGGVILLGMEESGDFAVRGVGDAHRLQEEITHLANSEMDPTLRPRFTLDDLAGGTVVAVEIDEIPAAQKPCFYKPAGLPKGAYLRVGNTNRQMTEYEVFGFLSNRGQPNHDEQPVQGATLPDLDAALVEAYLDALRRTRPKAGYLDGPRDEVLVRLHVVARDGAILCPTLAGLLAFGKYPQEFFPQLIITFVQYFGTAEEEKAPGGERFVDNERFEGPIGEMINRARAHILGAMRKSSLIEGVLRRDIPEYPEEALREAVSNAVAHRDYSPYVRGSYIQVRLFADRLEVQSPGGLYGNVTEDNLEEEHSTRNARLMRMMEDLHLVENRGSGIKAMVQALRGANLEPPAFDDRRSSFLVTFRNHTLMNAEAIAWLNQFADRPLNDRQRVALAYLRQHERMANANYRRLNRVDAIVAGQELRGLVDAALADQEGVGRWTTYRLTAPKGLPERREPQTDEDCILAWVGHHGSITNAECRELLGVNEDRAYYLLKKLTDAKKLRPQRDFKVRRYVLR